METPLEQILTGHHKADLVRFLKVHPGAFEETLKLALYGMKTFSWRAAWLLWSCIEKNDERVLPYITEMIGMLPNLDSSRQREFLKILQVMEISEASEGKLFDECMNVWEQTGKQPSVRFNALKLMVRIAKKHPELIHEIELITQDHYLESLSDGVKRSVSKLLKGVKKGTPSV